MDNLTLKSELGDNNFDVYESEAIVDIGNRLQARQMIAGKKDTPKEDIQENNSYDITPDNVTLLIKSFSSAITTSLILLDRKYNKIDD